MSDPDHPEHEEMKEWRGEIDPEAFDVKRVNERWANWDFGEIESDDEDDEEYDEDDEYVDD